MTDDVHQGKVALITGGGRGFGKAFGAALAARGAHVVLADIDGAAAGLGRRGDRGEGRQRVRGGLRRRRRGRRGGDGR